MITFLSPWFLIGLIAVALAFDFLNGRNDAANSIATIVSTRVLSPRYAVAWAAFFNFVAFLVFGPKKLPELGKGLGEGIRGFRSAMKNGTQPNSTTTSTDQS